MIHGGGGMCGIASWTARGRRGRLVGSFEVRSARVGAGFHCSGGGAGVVGGQGHLGQAGCSARRRSKASARWVAQAHPVGIFRIRVRA